VTLTLSWEQTRYGAPGVGGVIGLVLVVLLILWLVGALTSAVGPIPT
jgi:hypothetical protein